MRNAWNWLLGHHPAWERRLEVDKSPGSSAARGQPHRWGPQECDRRAIRGCPKATDPHPPPSSRPAGFAGPYGHGGSGRGRSRVEGYTRPKTITPRTQQRTRDAPELAEVARRTPPVANAGVALSGGRDTCTRSTGTPEDLLHQGRHPEFFAMGWLLVSVIRTPTAGGAAAPGSPGRKGLVLGQAYGELADARGCAARCGNHDNEQVLTTLASRIAGTAGRTHIPPKGLSGRGRDLHRSRTCIPAGTRRRKPTTRPPAV